MMKTIHLPQSSKLFHLIQRELLTFFNIWLAVAVKSIQFVILSLTCLKDQSILTWMHGQVKTLHVILFQVQIQRIGTTCLVFTLTCHSDHCWMNSISCKKVGDMRLTKMVRNKSKESFLMKWKEHTKVLKDSLWSP